MAEDTNPILFLMQSLQFSSIKQYSYQWIHATLGAEAV